LARYNSVNAQAQQAAAAPFQVYSTDPSAFVAPVNAQQQAGIGTINNAGAVAPSYYGAATSAAQGAYAGAQPYMNSATGFALAGGQAVDPSQIDASTIGQYMNPYLGTVLGSTEALINQTNQQQQAGQMGNAISSGAFGGDRSGIAAAVLAGQQQLAAGQTYSGILSDAYNQALSTAQQQQGVNLAAAQANRAALQQTGQSMAALAQQGFGMGQSNAQLLASLGQGLQGAELQQGQAELGAGQVEQQTQQAGLTALYNQFLQQQSYPFQTAQFLANIAEGTGALSGSTTTGTQPGGLFMSDERVKEDMQPVGKGFDGANIYRFRYKGDPTWRMGLSAQETERRHPEAVAETPSGFKAVEYGRATQEAAERGGFANAANDNAGWDAEPRRARQAGGYQGFGGVAYPAGVVPMDIGQMLQAQEGSFGPFAGSGLYGGSASGAPHGGSSYVPQANVPIAHLAPAELPKPRENYDPIHQAAQDAGDARSFWNQGKSLVQGGQKMLAAHADAAAARAASSPATQAAWHDLPTSYGSAQAAESAESAAKDAAADVSSAAQDTASAAQDATADASSLFDIGSAAGGFIGARRRRGRADGGFDDTPDSGSSDPTAPPQGTDPYHPQGAGLDIPDTQSTAQLHPADLPKPQKSGFMEFMDDAAQIAKTAGQFAGGARRGGRIGFATGGDPTNDLISDLETADRNSDLDALLRQTLTTPAPQRRRPAGFANAVAPESPADGPGGPAAPAPGLAAAARPSGAPGAAPTPAGFAGTLRSEGTGLNPLSGANGPGQFLPRTFLGEFKKVFPDRAAGMSDAQILALHGTPEGNALQAQMVPHLRADNAATLQAQNIPVNPATEHVMWILGPHEGPRVLQADPSTPMENLVRPIAIRENPHIMAGKTAGQFVQWADRSIRATGGAVRRGFAGAGVVGPDDPSVVQDDSVDTSMGIHPDDTSVAPPPRKARADDTAGFGGAAAPPQPPLGMDPYLNVARARQEVQQDKYDQLVAAQNQKKPGVLGWLAQPEHWIPLAEAAGAAASAPTSHPLTALLVGGASGAAAYQQQRAYDMANARQAAETATVGTGTQAQAAGVPITAYEAQTQRLNVAGPAFQHALNIIDARFAPIKLANGMPGYRDTMTGQQYSLEDGTNARNALLQQAYQLYGAVAGGWQNPVAAAIGPSNGSPPSGQSPGAPAQPSLPARAAPLGAVSLGNSGGAGGHTIGPGVVAGPDGFGGGGAGGAGGVPAHQVGSPVAPTAHTHAPLAAGASVTAKLANGDYATSGVPLQQVDTSQLQDLDNPDMLRAAVIANNAAGRPGDADAAQKRYDEVTGGHGTLPRRKDGTFETGYQQNAQAVANNMSQQQTGQAVIDHRNAEASQFFDPNGQYSTTKTLVGDLTRLYGTTDPEGMESAWADIVAKARGTPFESVVTNADKRVQEAYQTGKKDTMRLAFTGAAGALGAEILHGAPAAGLSGSQAALPDPSLGPATRFSIISQLQGALDQKAQQLTDWRANRQHVTAPNVSDYDTDWAKEHPIDGFNQRAADKIPYFQGMSLAEKEAHPRHPTSAAQVQNWPKATAQNPDHGTPFIIPSGRYKGRMAITDARSATGFSLVPNQ